MIERLPPDALKRLLGGNTPFALLDVRDPVEYNEGHIPGATSLPRGELEFRIGRLVPHTGTQVVVCDDDGRRADLAARTLERMGYRHTAVLEGGIVRWRDEGHPTEWGTNVPSKDFGERVLVQHRVPEISVQDLHARLRRGEKLVLLDARTPEEHQHACIPGSRSLPNGEMALRALELAQNPDATVVVHCAGRTRSIIGARLLQRMGLPRVYALKNGTMGWSLAGLELEHGSQRLDLPQPSPKHQRAAEAFARRIAAEDGVRLIGVSGAQAIVARASRENVYLVDVRTREEYEGGHITGFRWFPGGQAVQKADEVVGVRQGHILFACDGLVRATVTASWYRQMGFPNVYALDGGTQAWREAGLALEPGMPDEAPFGLEEALKRVPLLPPWELQRALADGEVAATLFVDTSVAFQAGHVLGSLWLPRAWLELRVEAVVPSRDALVVVTCADGRVGPLAAVALMDTGYRHVAALRGGLEAWQGAGLPIEVGATNLVTQPKDSLASGTERTPEEMLRYLAWEEALGEKYAR